MIAWFFVNVMEGVLTPRRSARRMLKLGVGMREAGLFILLSYLLFAIFVLILPPKGLVAEGQGNHFMGVISWTLVVLLIAWFAWLPPKVLGGSGSWKSVFPVTAWMIVLVVMMLPLGLLGLQAAPVLEVYRLAAQGDVQAAQDLLATVPEGDLMTFSVFATICTIGSLWVFSGFIAELHGFPTWAVVLVMFALNFFLPMIL
ncbi:MAG: hypothetical protein AAF415_03120 [Pseudomonadota bacterium]